MTPEQEALFQVYREKWQRIALSTEPIDPQRATEAIKTAHVTLWELHSDFFQKINCRPCEEEPNVVLCDSPYAVWWLIEKQLEEELECHQEFSQLYWLLWKHLACAIAGDSDVWARLWYTVKDGFSAPDYPLYGQLLKQLYEPLAKPLENLSFHLLFTPEAPRLLRERRYSNLIGSYRIPIEGAIAIGGCFDFLISALNYSLNQRAWKVYQLLIRECGYYIQPFGKTWFVCHRPIKLSVDSQLRFHAEGEPALQFADGYSLYAYHGVWLPKKYGTLPPQL